ncbi:TPA: nucleotide exchange factor GrpE [Candidatus Dependentiae bacterium]|nr:MAG: Protein GrpE [candidate division TM6 bacterium GW2011_GWE2_31_21]KKP53510.1 MAG: Protein GrpE [candidate division TM6 bacterium GW2011_GWF2_33_332]HBS48249.1 nucleotide exchange factor GrpE [Candidatus Dependentiae bacterium]HBZ73675.1 nucleotide exchange factor GrpE [Candidatus Dependentiae bacterium]
MFQSEIDEKDLKEKTDNSASEVETGSKGVEPNYWETQFLRITADFQNYKRRAEKEKFEIIKIAQSEVIRSLLPVIDDIDMALKSSQKIENSEEMQKWVDGVQLIRKNLIKRLADLNVVEIDCSGNFDPNLHEAIMQTDSQNHKSGEIVEVFSLGFLHNGEVVRHAKVSVAK